MDFAEEVSKLLVTTKEIARKRASNAHYSGQLAKIGNFSQSVLHLSEDVAVELSSAWESLREELQVSEDPQDPQTVGDIQQSSNPADQLYREVSAVEEAHKNLITASAERDSREGSKDRGFPWKKALSWAKTVIESILSLLKLSKRAQGLLTVIGEGIDLAKA